MTISKFVGSGRLGELTMATVKLSSTCHEYNMHLLKHGH